MTTIRTVAAHAGVSPSTVSRVFTQPAMVTVAARRRVLAAADALGYAPNPVARSLARGRTGNLGLVVPDIANPYFGPLVKAVQQHARRGDFALFVADSDEQVADELTLAQAMAKQVDGLVLASSRLADRHLRELAARTPLVLIDRELDGLPAVLTRPDEGLAQAVEHLTALGHAAVVYLAGPDEAYANDQRRRALRTLCDRSEVPLTELGPFAPHFESGVRAADLVLRDGATAVVAYNDSVALGLLARLSQRGCRVGSDLSVIGIDDTWFARMAHPALTTVRVPADAAGAAAVRLLIDLALGRDAGRPTVELPTELIVRASTGPAPGTGAGPAPDIGVRPAPAGTAPTS